EVGVGWTLGGVSAISRCPQTIEQDGISRPKRIGLNDEDRFCLDGERLVSDPASGVDGADGTQYRTEFDDFSRITSFGTAGNGPAWFRVERKDGTVIEYGNSPDSRIEARGSENEATVLVWARNRMQDRSGDYILYGYVENSAGPVAYSLSTIDYTGNVRAGTQPSARLSFTYINRTEDQDLTHSFLAGVQFEQRRLLTSIRSQGRKTAGGALEDLRVYDLSYGQDGLGRQILVAFTECRSVARVTCYPSTRFEWLKSESRVDQTGWALNGLLPKRTLSGILLADVSGDGRPDLLYTESRSARHYLHVQKATSAANFNEWTTEFSLPQKAGKTPPRVLAVDINADGYQDVVYVKYSKATDDYTWVTRLSAGNSLSGEVELNPGHRFSLAGEDLESHIRILDFNGDGLSDILHTHTDPTGNAWFVSLLLNTTTPASAPRVADPVELELDNSELFPFIKGAEWEQSVSPPFFIWEPAAGNSSNTPDAKVFDFNGDGAVDLLLHVWRDYQRCISNCVENSQSSHVAASSKKAAYEVNTASFWVLMESNGLNAFNRRSVVALGEDCTFSNLCDAPEYQGLPRVNYLLPVDLNADGLADLAWGDPDSAWKFQLNTGLGFTTAQHIGQVPEDTDKLVRFQDWNGDGYPDLVYPSGVLNDDATWMVYQNHFGREFAASIDTLVPAANVGGDHDNDPVENDASVFADFNGDGKTDMLLID
ncbi:MAG: VCBS repeat-containing protein, partial [Xanthomonadales bacterium]|nr:VCBS repeat-containing protein [Xanthomonadales bacterium]